MSNGSDMMCLPEMSLRLEHAGRDEMDMTYRVIPAYNDPPTSRVVSVGDRLTTGRGAFKVKPGEPGEVCRLTVIRGKVADMLDFLVAWLMQDLGVRIVISRVLS